jgi:hypothetical protein
MKLPCSSLIRQDYRDMTIMQGCLMLEVLHRGNLGQARFTSVMALHYEHLRAKWHRNDPLAKIVHRFLRYSATPTGKLDAL